MAYWFAPGEAAQLGACRIAACAILLYCFAWRDFAPWGRVPDVFWMPIASFRDLGLPRAGSGTLALLQLVWKLSLATTALGLLTRVSAVTAAVLGFYLVGLPHNFGKTDHADTVVPLVLGVLAASRCGDALSVDAWLRRRRGAAAPAPDGAYTWPIRAVWMLTGLVFGAAGISKIRYGGVDRFASDSMRYILLKHHYGGFRPWWPALGLSLAEHPWLYWPLAAGAVLVETLSPLVTVSRVARATLVPALFAMLFGFHFTFGFSPRPFYALFVFFVPWTRIGARGAGRRPPAERAPSGAGPDPRGLRDPRAEPPDQGEGDRELGA